MLWYCLKFSFIFLLGSLSLLSYQDGPRVLNSYPYALKGSDAIIKGEILSFSSNLKDEQRELQLLIKAKDTLGLKKSEKVNGNLFRVSLKLDSYQQSLKRSLRLKNPAIFVLRRSPHGYYLKNLVNNVFYLKRQEGSNYVFNDYMQKKLLVSRFDEIAYELYQKPFSSLNVDNLVKVSTTRKARRLPASLITGSELPGSSDNHELVWFVFILGALGCISVKLCFRED